MLPYSYVLGFGLWCLISDQLWELMSKNKDEL
jgi:hypothetical protein